MKTRDKETVRKISDFPAPMTPSEPVIFSDEHSAVLSYQIAQPDGEESYAIVHFTGLCSSQWTPFSQEGLGKHPLSKHGLRWFSVNEVENSTYCKFIGFESNEFFKRRHLVFQFEDSTFECISEAQELHIHKAGAEPLLDEMLKIYKG